MSDGLRLAAVDSGPMAPKGICLQPPIDFGSFALGPHQVPVPPCGCVTHEKPEYQRLLVLSQTTDTHVHTQTHVNTYTDTLTHHIHMHTQSLGLLAKASPPFLSYLNEIASTSQNIKENSKYF